MRAREIGEKVLAVLMMLCIICGLILMMCESDDWNTQRLTLFGGLGLFMVGMAPGIIISLRDWGRDHG